MLQENYKNFHNLCSAFLRKIHSFPDECVITIFTNLQKSRIYTSESEISARPKRWQYGIALDMVESFLTIYHEIHWTELEYVNIEQKGHAILKQLVLENRGSIIRKLHHATLQQMPSSMRNFRGNEYKDADQRSGSLEP